MLSSPVFVSTRLSACWLSADGELETLTPQNGFERARQDPPLVCYKPQLFRLLDTDPFPVFDILELFAFVRPAQFAVPTPAGIARQMSLPDPGSNQEDACLTLADAAVSLLKEYAARPNATADALLSELGHAGWPWAGPLLAQLSADRRSAAQTSGLSGPRAFQTWVHLPEWQDDGGQAPPTAHPVSPGEAVGRLQAIRPAQGPGGGEERPQQAAYASALASAFSPADEQGKPNVVLAEAGTGVGKTLGYIAPASVWAEKNKGPVWLSTYTRNLQRQIDDELNRLYPQAAEKARKVVVRKGRENYLCLLNFEEAVQRFDLAPEARIALGLIARWLQGTRDGDIIGGDFPGWLNDVLSITRIGDLTDMRRECIHSGCRHYKRCFVEQTVRRSKRANLVIANHALVMTQAGHAPTGGDGLPQHLVFDEGHHIFDAADSAFATELSGLAGQELRRWLIGTERRVGGRTGRLKGLSARLIDLDVDLGEHIEALTALQAGARHLPAGGWAKRLREGEPFGATEEFLGAVATQVYARAQNASDRFSLECDITPATGELTTAAQKLHSELEQLVRPLKALHQALGDVLVNEAATLETETRRRIEALQLSIQRRGLLVVQSWQAMLTDLAGGSISEGMVSWLAVIRTDGRDRDVGYFCHFIDPTLPFMAVHRGSAQGFVITSATLRDQSGETEADWVSAEELTGTRYLTRPAVRTAVPSPFDYGRQARVFIVNDLSRRELPPVAAAMRELFVAAGGGGLGLFTAIARLQAVHEQIAAPLERKGISLLAQHVDPMNVGTLIDLFRADEDACLLGTDAVRDGVDVPGRSLRLVAFDRVPWPRPDIRHRARREAFGGRAYDDRLVRFKLRQAFGRLIRRTDDKGVFVLLEGACPTRLLTAFPDGVPVERLGLKDTIDAAGSFLA